jgi:hypothetical protein
VVAKIDEGGASRKLRPANATLFRSTLSHAADLARSPRYRNLTPDTVSPAAAQLTALGQPAFFGALFVCSSSIDLD